MTSEDSTRVEVVVARIEERLKTLEVKMDGNQRELLAKVETTRRETDQVSKLTGDRMDHIVEKIANQRAEIETDRKAFKDLVEELANRVVTKERYQTVEKVVFGMVGLLLTGFGVAILRMALGG